jgi:hypothetical protein
MRHEEEERGGQATAAKERSRRTFAAALKNSPIRSLASPFHPNTHARALTVCHASPGGPAQAGARHRAPPVHAAVSVHRRGGERRRSVLKGGAMRPEARRCPVAWRRARRARARIGGQGHEARRPFSRAAREREERNQRRHRRAGTLAKTSPLPLIPPARLSPSLCFPLPQHHGRPAHPARAHGDDPAQG